MSFARKQLKSKPSIEKV